MTTRLPAMRFPAAIAILALVASCGWGSSEVMADVSDEEIENVAGAWVNQLGLVQTDPNEWRDRLTDLPREYGIQTSHSISPTNTSPNTSPKTPKPSPEATMPHRRT